MTSVPSLEHVRTFVVVSRVGSISEAARLVGVSQPTASAHLAALERTLGYALVERSSRGIALTPRGEEFAREVSSAIDTIEDAVGASPERRVLHLGGPAELLSTMVLPSLAALGLPVRVTFGLADDLLESLRAGALDLVVSAVRPRITGVESVALYDEEFVLVAAPSWAGTTIDEIPVVAYAEPLPIVRRYWLSVFEKRPDALVIAAVVPDLRGIATALESGIGMSVLPEYLVRDRLATGRLVVLHEPAVRPLNTVYVAARSRELKRDPVLHAAADALHRLVSEF